MEGRKGHKFGVGLWVRRWKGADCGKVWEDVDGGAAFGHQDGVLLHHSNGDIEPAIRGRCGEGGRADRGCNGTASTTTMREREMGL